MNSFKVWLKAVLFVVLLAAGVQVCSEAHLAAWDLAGNVAAADEALAQATATPSVTVAATQVPSTPGTPSPVPTTTGTPKPRATSPISPSLTVEPSPTAVPSSTATPSPTAAPSSTPLPTPTALLIPTPTVTVVLAELPETPTPVHSSEQEQLGALTILSFVGFAAFVIILAVVWVLRKPIQK